MSIGPSEHVDPGYEIVDGIPHMTYQNPHFDINFVWDGVFEHPIMVCPFGYGEPPLELLHVSNQVPGEMSPARALAWFAMQCEDYLLANRQTDLVRFRFIKD